MIICKKTGKPCCLCKLGFIDDITKCEHRENTEEKPPQEKEDKK